jgi:TATA-binding protein-associated factor
VRYCLFAEIWQFELTSHALVCSLRDQDDDVRAVAAATLLPITETIVEQLPNELSNLLGVLWGCLRELKDDLSSSMGVIMDLLSKFMTFPAILELVQSRSQG